jgi:hypothetical protein
MLWGSLKARGLTIPFGREIAQGAVEANEGVRFFGALVLGLGSLESVVEILEEERMSHLIALRPEHEPVVKTLVSTGWQSKGLEPSPEVVTAVCGVGGVVLWLVGEFDDREAGVAALAEIGVIEELVRSISRETAGTGSQ